MEDDRWPEKSIWRLFGIDKQLREHGRMTLPVFVHGHHRQAGLQNTEGRAWAQGHWLYGGSRWDSGHLMFEYRQVRAACTLE